MKCGYLIAAALNFLGIAISAPAEARYPGLEGAKRQLLGSSATGAANQSCGQLIHGNDGCQFLYEVTCGKSIVKNDGVIPLTFGGYYNNVQGCANLCDHWMGCNVANYSATNGRCDVYTGLLVVTQDDPNGYLIARTIPGGTPSLENCTPGIA